MGYLRNWLYFPEEKKHALILLFLIPIWALASSISKNSIFDIASSLKELPKFYLLLFTVFIFIFNGFLIWKKSSSAYVSSSLVIRTTTFTTIFLSIIFYLFYSSFVILIGESEVVILGYEEVDVRSTAMNLFESLLALTCYLTAGYLFRSSTEKAYVLKKSRKRSLLILNRVKAEKEISKKCKKELLENLSSLVEHRKIIERPIHYKERELLRLWSDAAKKVISIVKDEPAKDIEKKVRVNEGLLEESIEDMKKEVGDL